MLGTILIFNKLPRMLVVLVAAALMLAACGDGGSNDGERLQVVASTSIAGDLVAQIAGDDADVTVLMPIGTDPHDFQPSSQQVASLRSADLVVAWGLGLEEGLGDVLASAKADGVRVVELSPMLDPIEFASEHDEHEGEDPDHADEDSDEDHVLDPHTWNDPVRMADAARLIGNALAEVAPGEDIMERAEAVAARMMELNEEITQILAAIPEERRKLVTNHDSLGYLADRYGFEVIGVAIPGGSTLTAPSSAQIAELVHAIEDAGVTVLFSESSTSPAVLEAVAGEVEDVTVVELIEGSLAPAGEPGDTLAGMLVHNAELIADALG